MTVQDTSNKIQYTGDGVTTGPYAFTFPTQEAWMFVYVAGVIFSETGYTLTVNADQEASPGGQVDFDVAVADQDSIVILRTAPLTQESDYNAYDAFPAERAEDDFDERVIVDQQQQEEIDRSLRIEVDSASNPIIPDGDPLFYWRWDATGENIEYVDLASFGAPTVANLVTFDPTVTNDLTAADVQGAIDEITPQLTHNNHLINGNFDIWQRSTTSSAASGYVSADRFFSSSIANTTFSQSSTVPDGSQFSLNVVSAAAANPTGWKYRVEAADAAKLQGSEVTFSFKTNADTIFETYDLVVSTFDVKDVSGATTTQETIGLTQPATGSFGDVEATFTLTDSDYSNGFELQLLSINTSSIVDALYAQVKLEKGPVKTDMVFKSIEDELSSCQRYYWEPSISARFSLYRTNTGVGNKELNLAYPTAMRVAPTLVLATASTGIATATSLTPDTVRMASDDTTVTATILLTVLKLDAEL